MQLPESVKEGVRQTIIGFIPRHRIPREKPLADMFWADFRKMVNKAWGLSFKNKRHRVSENKRRSRNASQGRSNPPGDKAEQAAEANNLQKSDKTHSDSLKCISHPPRSGNKGKINASIGKISIKSLLNE